LSVNLMTKAGGRGREGLTSKGTGEGGKKLALERRIFRKRR